ncbi:Aste57867_19874 [Aphanomyces stellatus]|uniref:Aste57867_19874 protein n=1 Tax=Aphanomyces stellatus TaxID=120398 RepID=A0A485LDN3_9STRA|nr:hypothetical protein As57867_019808 [Aphanomyces stellatus]VFT96572.1 Aste57867_19874 [Aphanomyces stellatus]
MQHAADILKVATSTLDALFLLDQVNKNQLVTWRDFSFHMFQCGVPMLDRVFATFSCLLQDGPPRQALQQHCLSHATAHCQFDIVHCLVRDMDVGIVRRVFAEESQNSRRAMERAFRQRKVAAIELLQVYGVPVADEHFKKALYHGLWVSKLAQWLQDKPRDKNDWFAWLAYRQGGRVVVMGELLVFIARTEKGLGEFTQLYSTWVTLVDNATVKNRVCCQCSGLLVKMAQAPSRQYFRAPKRTTPSWSMMTQTSESVAMTV